jgi:hypothetical protein
VRQPQCSPPTRLNASHPHSTQEGLTFRKSWVCARQVQMHRMKGSRSQPHSPQCSSRMQDDGIASHVQRFQSMHHTTSIVMREEVDNTTHISSPMESGHALKRRCAKATPHYLHPPAVHPEHCSGWLHVSHSCYSMTHTVLPSAACRRCGSHSQGIVTRGPVWACSAASPGRCQSTLWFTDVMDQGEGQCRSHTSRSRRLSSTPTHLPSQVSHPC